MCVILVIADCQTPHCVYLETPTLGSRSGECYVVRGSVRRSGECYIVRGSVTSFGGVLRRSGEC